MQVAQSGHFLLVPTGVERSELPCPPFVIHFWYSHFCASRFLFRNSFAGFRRGVVGATWSGTNSATATAAAPSFNYASDSTAAGCATNSTGADSPDAQGGRA
jgi:hypothetical protein